MGIGVIGCGNMGSMLAKAFSQTVEKQVWVYNRTPAKAVELSRQYPHITAELDLSNWIQNCEVVLLCVGKKDLPHLLAQVAPMLQEHQLLGTTCTAFSLAELGKHCKATPFLCVPSLTQHVNKGSILLSVPPSHTSSVTQLQTLFAAIAKPIFIQESQIRIFSDLTSCGPAFFAEILLTWSKAAANTRRITENEAREALLATVEGTLELLHSGMTMEEIQASITVPGGVTSRGLDVLHEPLLQVFRRLHEATQAYAKQNNKPYQNCGCEPPDDPQLACQKVWPHAKI